MLGEAVFKGGPPLTRDLGEATERTQTGQEAERTPEAIGLWTKPETLRSGAELVGRTTDLDEEETRLELAGRARGAGALLTQLAADVRPLTNMDSMIIRATATSAALGALREAAP